MRLLVPSHRQLGLGQVLHGRHHPRPDPRLDEHHASVLAAVHAVHVQPAKEPDGRSHESSHVVHVPLVQPRRAHQAHRDPVAERLQPGLFNRARVVPSAAELQPWVLCMPSLARLRVVRFDADLCRRDLRPGLHQLHGVSARRGVPHRGLLRLEGELH
eukprot:Amastigsp_a1207_476.p3 type:complete len:158 gc:universal Amastigsp_a1207_476:546-1019(+)